MVDHDSASVEEDVEVKEDVAETVSQWEFLGRMPTRDEVMALLESLPQVWDTAPAHYADFVQALPQRKKFQRPAPGNPKVMVEEYIDAHTLYVSVAGRQRMINDAQERLGWRVDFVPEPVTPTGIPGYLRMDERLVYREYCEVHDKDGRLLGRRPGTAWVPQKDGKAAAGSNPYEKCVHPDTPVLTADLRWVPASDLGVGDALFAFDENPSSRGVGQRFRKAVVESHLLSEKPSVTVVAGGSTVTCSADHQFVVSRKGTWRRWVAASDLVPGDRIVTIGEPWETPNDYDAGWLAGFLDGEGHVGNGLLRFTQVKGAVIEQACRILEKYGIPYGLNVEDRSVKGGQDVVRGHVTGGHLMSVRALGMFRPVRLDADATWVDRRSFGKSLRVAIVESVVPVGVQPVVVMQTSTRTFIANGWLSHNCETSARGRALAAWGFGVLPGSGIASLEEMQQIKENRNAMGQEAKDRPQQGSRQSPEELREEVFALAEATRQERGLEKSDMDERVSMFLTQNLGLSHVVQEDGSIDWGKVKAGQLTLLRNSLRDSLRRLRDEQSVV